MPLHKLIIILEEENCPLYENLTRHRKNKQTRILHPVLWSQTNHCSKWWNFKKIMKHLLLSSGLCRFLMTNTVEPCFLGLSATQRTSFINFFKTLAHFSLGLPFLEFTGVLYTLQIQPFLPGTQALQTSFLAVYLPSSNDNLWWMELSMVTA